VLRSVPRHGLRSRLRLLRRRGHDWLQAHPRVAAALRLGGCLRGGPEPVARGLAIGAFVALTPTAGFQTVLMVVACIVLRANFPAAFAISWISNPFTIAPLYWAFHELGETLLGVAGARSIDPSSGPLMGARDELVATAAGSIAVATLAGCAVYLAARRLGRGRAAHGAGRVGATSDAP